MVKYYIRFSGYYCINGVYTMGDNTNIIGLLNVEDYPESQRQLVLDFNKKLIALNEDNTRLAMTISRKEQRRQTSISDVVRVYNINLSTGMIEDEIYERLDGQENETLASLGLSVPCYICDFVEKMLELRVSDRSKEDFKKYYDPKRLIEAYVEGELHQQLEYKCKGPDGKEQIILHTMLLTKETSLNHIIAMCSAKDISRQVKSEKQLKDAYTTIDQSLGIIESLVKDYYEIWLIDPRTRIMSLFSVKDGARVDAVTYANGKTYEEGIEYYIENHIAEKDKDRIRREADFNRIVYYLEHNDGVIAINFMRKSDVGIMSYQQVSITKAKLENGGYSYIMALKDVDTLIKREIGIVAQEERLKQFESDAKAMELIHESIGSGSWNVDFDERANVDKVSYSYTFRKMLGYEEEGDFPNELESWMNLLYGDDKERVTNAFWRAVNDYTGSVIFDEEFRLYTQDKGLRYFSALGRLSRRFDGRPDKFVGLLFDVEEKKKKEASLRQQMQIVEALSRDYLNIYKVNIKERSACALKLEGYGLKGIVADGQKKYAYDAVVRQYIKERVFEDDAQDMKQAMDLEVVKKKLEQSTEYVHGYRVMQDGDIHYYQFKYFMIKGDNDDENLVIAGFKNIDNVVEDAIERQNLITQAQTDIMTGVLNRGSGERKIIESIKAGNGGMLVVLDVDHFKSINDTFGHNIGDKVIKGVASALKEAFREQDIVLRLGGDEFAVYATRVSTKETGSRILDRFVKEIDNLQIAELGQRDIATSIGALIVPQNCKEDFETLYKRVDACVYEAKEIDGTAIIFA